VAALTLTPGSGRTARDGRTLPVIPAGSPGIDAGLPAALASHKSGGRDLWSPPRSVLPLDPEQGVWECLMEVLDPEIPISLVDLGLIYGVDWHEGSVRVRITYTATACPCMEFIREDVRDRLEQESWISSVELEDVWDPPWTRARISDRGRAQLREMGMGA
jgi:metal-sulfur cluster biosynthetic enzyme